MVGLERVVMWHVVVVVAAVVVDHFVVVVVTDRPTQSRNGTRQEFAVPRLSLPEATEQQRGERVREWLQRLQRPEWEPKLLLPP